MPVIIHNEAAADIIIAAGLMSNGSAYDIEPGTTGVFTYLASTGKLFDNGGSAYARDIQENLNTTNSTVSAFQLAYAAHEHNGTDAPKVKAANLDTQGVTTQDYVLALSNLGVPTFKDMRTYVQATARWSNTNTTTDVTPSSSWTEIPLMGSMERRDSNTTFIPVGNGIEVNWTGRIKVRAHVVVTASVQNTQIDAAFKKNTVVQPRIASAFARVVSGANEATCFLYDELDVVPGDKITVVARQGGTPGQMYMMAANSCFLEVEIPPGAFAKGDKGDAGYAGWKYWAQAGVPSNLLGDDGDVYLDTDNSNFYQRTAGTWTLKTNLKGIQGEQGVSKSMLWAERLGSLTDGSEEWAFGAATGSGSGRGILQLVSGKITHLGLELITAGTESTSVELLINGVPTSSSITLAPNVNKGYVALGTQVAFGVGDVIGFRTVLAGQAVNGRVSALATYDGVIVAPQGYVIPTRWKHTVNINTTDIANGYITLPHLAMTNSILGFAEGAAIHEGEDYTASTVSGQTRITFINNFAAGQPEALEVGDTFHFKYEYQ